VNLTFISFTFAAIIILLFITILWWISLIIKNASIIDIFWGIGFVILAWLEYSISSFISPAKLLLTILVTLWGIRLALHIGIRNWGQPEDFRYAKWRSENGASWWWVSYFKVFLLQGLIMWIVAAPILSLRVTDGIPPLSAIDLFAASIWTVGWVFETLSDLQLTRFKANPGNKGKLLTTSLWKYTRHPNYFGDALQWWAFYLIAANTGAWWTIFSPLLMTFLLIKVSGVTLLEKTMVSKPGYEDYMKKTSSFFPLPPKK
jgi:steroid 5-alpha reductase family enzyme